MRIVIAGGHGQVGLRLGGLLAGGAHHPVGLVRDPAQIAALRDAGVTPLVVDLEAADADELAELLTGADAVVFAAGAGPGSGAARKDTVDRGAAAALAQACERAGVERYLLLSSAGVEQVRGGDAPEGLDDVMAVYLRAKLAAEDDLRARPLAWTVLRPGALSDEPGTGAVQLTPDADGGPVTRDDVAAVLAALLDAPGTAGQVLGLSGGDVPVTDAVAAVAAP